MRDVRKCFSDELKCLIVKDIENGTRSIREVSERSYAGVSQGKQWLEEFGQYKPKRFPLALMCRALRASPQGYYQRDKRTPRREERERSERELNDTVGIVHARSRRTYLRVRVTKELKAEGFCVNEKRIGRIMREEGLHAVDR